MHVHICVRRCMLYRTVRNRAGVGGVGIPAQAIKVEMYFDRFGHQRAAGLTITGPGFVATAHDSGG